MTTRLKVRKKRLAHLDLYEITLFLGRKNYVFGKWLGRKEFCSKLSCKKKKTFKNGYVGLVKQSVSPVKHFFYKSLVGIAKLYCQDLALCCRGPSRAGMSPCMTSMCQSYSMST